MAKYDDDDDRDREDDMDIGRRRGRGGDSEAASRLAGPAIALMVVSGLHMFLMLCLGLPYNILVLVGTVAVAAQNQGMDFGPIPNIIWIFISSGVQGFIVFGALQMKKGQSYGICMAAAILSVIPLFCSSCYCFGIPFGIWALVVLMDQQVKGSFRS